MKSKYTEKQILAKSLNLELSEIRKQQYKLGFFELEKPIQKGWKRQFYVRADVLRSSDGERYKVILPHVQNSQVSRTTDFYKREELKLQKIPESLKEKINFPEFFWDKYFVLRTDYNSGYKTGVEFKYKKAYFIKNKWVFDVVIIPNFITKLPIIDPALESREKELTNKIKKLNLGKTIDKMLFGYASWRRDDYYMNFERNREILKEMEKEVRQELNIS